MANIDLKADDNSVRIVRAFGIVTITVATIAAIVKMVSDTLKASR